MLAIKTVLSQPRYAALAVGAALLFALAYPFAWNFILLPNFYVRYDLLTLPNIAFWAAAAALSGLLVSTNAWSLRRGCGRKGSLLAIPAATFTSACSGCAPLLLSFSPATFGFWMGWFAPFNAVAQAAILLLLGAALWRSARAVKCSARVK